MMMRCTKKGEHILGEDQKGMFMDTEDSMNVNIIMNNANQW